MDASEGPRCLFIGFNHAIEQAPVSRLLGTIGAALEKKPRPRAICLCISSSSGGSLEQAFYAFEILRALPRTIAFITHNVGTVASAATLLFLAGRKRFAVPGATFLFHDVTRSISSQGLRPADIALAADSLARDEARMIEAVGSCVQRSADEVRGWLREEMRPTSFALEHGIIDAVSAIAMEDVDEFVQILA